jgi:hypothetical protein
VWDVDCFEDDTGWVELEEDIEEDLVPVVSEFGLAWDDQFLELQVYC